MACLATGKISEFRCPKCNEEREIIQKSDGKYADYCWDCDKEEKRE